MPTDRATARAQLAQRALAASAAERVVRIALGDLPVSLVARATSQLRRFFSGGPWSAEDDAALAAAVGPGSGWYEEELDPELTLAFGWRGGAFRADVRYTPAVVEPDPGVDDRPVPTAHESPRTLGDTFEDAVVLELGRTPTELCFRVGPGAGANATFTRDNAGADPRVAAAFGASALTRRGEGRCRHAHGDHRRRVALARRVARAVRHDRGPLRAAPRRAGGSPARTRQSRAGRPPARQPA